MSCPRSKPQPALQCALFFAGAPQVRFHLMGPIRGQCICWKQVAATPSNLHNPPAQLKLLTNGSHCAINRAVPELRQIMLLVVCPPQSWISQNGSHQRAVASAGNRWQQLPAISTLHLLS
jgi:hypothetical protein